MPTSVVGFLILIVAVLPGVPGDKIYRLLVGADWREEQWQRVVRLLGFSVVGLALYSVGGSLVGAPPPTYLSPDRVVEAFEQPAQIRPLFIALLGHFVGSGVAGLGGAVLARGIVRWTSLTLFTSAWDHFVYQWVPKHWVVVRLDSGETYGGMLALADTSVREEERDLVLEEPAEFDEEKSEYISMNYQHLFLPGRLISSVAAVHDPDIDTRVTIIGKPIFKDKQ